MIMKEKATVFRSIMNVRKKCILKGQASSQDAFRKSYNEVSTPLPLLHQGINM